MSRALKTYLLVFAVLIAVMIVIDQTRQKPLDWSPSYYLDEKKPLDLYVLNQEIDRLFDDSVVRYSKSPFEYFQHQDSLDTPKETYLFIRESVYIDKVSTNKILNAVKQGSMLFIASDGFDPYLTDTLQAICEYVSYSLPVLFNSHIGDRPGMKLKFSREEWDDDEYIYSPVFGQYAFVHADTTFSTALGYMTLPNESEYISFMEFRFGEGKILLHNQPVAFSNYSLMSGEALQEYAERVLSYLPDQPVVWFVASQQHNERLQRSQLSVIFKYPALRMTWLIFVYGLIGFIFFTAKRKQRVVPVIKPVKNTTVEFVQTIGNLYFQEGNTSDIARKKIIYFLDRVRRTYNMDTQLPEDKLIQRLCLKSGKEEELIKEIFSLIEKVNHQPQCSKQQLIQLSTLMDRFWERS